MEREDETADENYIFGDKSLHSTDKLSTLRKESIASHINRIRFAIEKRKRMESERSNYGQPKGSTNRSSKKRTYNRHFSSKNEHNESPPHDANEANRFLTLHVNNPFYRHSELSEDMEHGVNDTANTQGGMHVISESYESNSGLGKKSRKQWEKTIKRVSNVTKTGEDNTAERKGEQAYSGNISVKNSREFNDIQTERNEESIEYDEKMIPAKLPATDKIANVVQWIESLPPPESGEPILEPVPYETSNERSDFYEITAEDILIKQNGPENDSKIFATDLKDTKTRRLIKQRRNVSALSETKPKERKNEKEGMKALPEKAEPSNREALKTKNDSPLKVAYTPKGNLKVVICLKKLKPKDTALLVWFGDFMHSMSNEKNTSSSKKLKKGFTHLNDQQMEIFENIFKNKNATGDEKSE